MFHIKSQKIKFPHVMPLKSENELKEGGSTILLCVTDGAESFEILTFSTCAQVPKNLGEGWSRLDLSQDERPP